MESKTWSARLRALCRPASGPAGTVAFLRNKKSTHNRQKPRQKEQCFAEFAQRFAADHTGLRDDEDFWDRCNEQFDAELLTDLALSCAMWLGMGRMLRTLDIGQSCKITL